MKRFIASLSILALLVFVLPHFASATTVYATLDPSNKDSHITLSGGNLVATKDGTSSHSAVRATVVPTTGKWYWECTLTSATDGVFGFSNGQNSLTSNMADAWSTINPGKGAGFLISSTVWYNGSNARSGLTATTGDVLGFALNADTGDVSFYKNNSLVQTLLVGTAYGQVQVWQNMNPTYAELDLSQASSVVTCNFGATALTYTPPSGYNAGLYSTVVSSSFQLWPFSLF